MKCPICEQVIRKKPVVFHTAYFPRLWEDKTVCKKCYNTFSEQDIYDELASLDEYLKGGMTLRGAMEFRKRRIRPTKPQAEMKCPICKNDFYDNLQGIIFREKDFPALGKDAWICNKCYSTYKENAIIEKISHLECPICKHIFHDNLQGVVFRRKEFPKLDGDTWICKECTRTYKENYIIDKVRHPDLPKIYDEQVYKKSGLKEFLAWFFWGSATALAFGITLIGLTNINTLVGLIFIVFGGGFLSACLAKLVQRIRTK